MTTFDATTLFVPNDEPFAILQDKWTGLGYLYESNVWSGNEQFLALSVSKPASRSKVSFHLLFSPEYTDFMPLSDEPLDEPVSALCFGMKLENRAGDFAWMFTRMSEVPLTPEAAYDHLREYVITGDEEQGDSRFLYRHKKFVLESYQKFLRCLAR